ncbi:MAG: ABC transporter permease [Actinobacteria bacterium]|nr:ABC transporter permease [Actinomycetota bacterium]
MSTTPHRASIAVIDAKRRGIGLNVREIWAYRELLGFFAWRDFTARYKQTALGFAWAVLQPVLMTVVFTIFLGRLAKLPSDGIPYVPFVLAGLVPWTFFNNATTAGSESLVASGAVLSKVWFPRIVLPVGTALAWLPDVVIASCLLVGVAAVYGIGVHVTLLLAPAFLLLAMLVATAAATWLAPLNVAYRDVRYGLTLLMQLWLFATPVAYPASLVPQRMRPWLALNPMTSVIEGFRWCVIGGPRPGRELLVSLAVTLAALMSGLIYFHRSEPFFADVI